MNIKKSLVFLIGFVLMGCLMGCAAKDADLKDATKKESTVKEHKSGDWSPGLTDAEKETLFAICADTLAWCVNGKNGAFSFDDYDMTDKMKIQTHTFVTLKIAGNLRGCIGSLPPWPAAPLYQSVHENTMSAALRDPRFPGVQPRELSSIDIHLSILSPVKAIASHEEFVIGQHGIILSRGERRAVFLPEVAVEQKWDKSDTLTHLCRKAGLAPNAWREGCTFQVFESVGLRVGE